MSGFHLYMYIQMNHALHRDEKFNSCHIFVRKASSVHNVWPDRFFHRPTVVGRSIQYSVISSRIFFSKQRAICDQEVYFFSLSNLFLSEVIFIKLSNCYPSILF